MTNSRHRHWIADKHISRYLCGTIYYGLKYASNGGLLLLGYFDSDWGGIIVDQKNTSRYCLILGSAIIYLSKRKHGSVSQSTTEVDQYIVASIAGKESVWLRKLLGGLSTEKLEPTVVRCDN